MVSQGYGNTTGVRAFVINRDPQSRRLVTRTLQRCGCLVSECDSPLFGQDEYAGESLVVVDVRSLQDEVRHFLDWLKEYPLGHTGGRAYVIALAIDCEIDWSKHPDRESWDEIFIIPDELEHMCSRIQQIVSGVEVPKEVTINLDEVSPFELAEETGDIEEGSFSSRAFQNKKGEGSGIIPSILDGRKEANAKHVLTTDQPDHRLLVEIFDSVPYGVVVLARDGLFLYGNNEHAALLGIGIGETDSVEAWLKLVCPGEEHYREVLESWRKHVWRKQLVRTYAFRSTDGKIVDIEFRPKLLEDGSLMVTMSDVSDRSRFEEAWLLSDVKFKTLFGSRGIGMALVDRTGRICSVNTALEQMLDSSLEELRALSFDDFVHADDRERKREYELLARQEKKMAAEEIEISLVCKDGMKTPVILSAAFMEEQDGPFTAYLIRMNKNADSKEGRVMGGALQESLLQNRALLEAIPDLVILFDRYGLIEDVSPAEQDDSFGGDLCDRQGKLLEEWQPSFWKACVNAGLSEEEFHSHESVVLEFTLENGPAARAHIAGCGMGKYLAVIRRQDNEKEVDGGEQEKAHGSTVTVTEDEFESAREIAESCEWVEQLQTLSSLLNLEIDALPADPEKEKRSVLQKHQGRIRAIACLRAARLEPANGGSEQVSLPTYLKGLIAELLGSSRKAFELGIESQVDCVSLDLPAHKAFALGLYVTELLSNSIEHGLSDFQGGQVYVRLRRSDREAVLLVGDNGVGLPAGFDWERSPTLGFRVVNNLVAQLGGRLEIRPGENTEFLLRFPLDSKQSYE